MPPDLEPVPTAQAREERLDEILRRSGEPALQRIRDDAKGIAHVLGMREELHRLDGLEAVTFSDNAVELVDTRLAMAGFGMIP